TIDFINQNNDSLYSALTGGLANPMFSNIDLNNDGRQDLFIFDKREGKVLTFLSVKTKDSVRLQYAPQYESAFPKMKQWAYLKDFDGDGKADIFTHSSGINPIFNTQLAVLKNVSTKDSLKFEVYAMPVRRSTKSRTDDMIMSNTEIPTFEDIDDDGDIDVLQFDYTQTSILYYYKNMSQELYGHNDSLTYWLYDQCWGRVLELDDTHKEVNMEWNREDCSQGLVKRQKDGKHNGSAILALDADGDGDKDLMVSDVDRPNIVYLENGKIRAGQTPHPFDSIVNAYPAGFPFNKPIYIKNMPLAFSVDVNGNGSRDILVSPMDIDSQRTNFIWHYDNASKTARPQYKFAKSNFLEDRMVDLGLFSAPAFIYYNDDSLIDLLVAVQGSVAGQNSQHIVLFVNVGTKQKPVFKLAQEDFMGLASNISSFISLSVSDLDGDGKQDLLIGNDKGGVTFYKNIGKNGQANFSSTGETLKEKQGSKFVTLDAGNDSKPAMADMNNDGKPDLLIGNSTRFLSYYKNISTTSGTPDFELVSDTFLILPNGNLRLSPCVADMDLDGKPDLLISTNEGLVYLYPHISDTSKMLSPVKNIFYDISGKKLSQSAPGKNINIAVASLDQDGKPDLLLGNLRGGLYFMGSKNNGYKLPTAIQPDVVSKKVGKPSLLIYPNPAQQDITISWENMQPKNLHLVLTDISGKQVWQNIIATQNANSSQLQLPQLANGLYFVNMHDADGNVYQTQKLFIAK
ncbi:MAG: T9SS type A sorting domain-containing protein, partial [Sphingobacteriales bacterium]